MKNVAITGIAGYLGSLLIDALEREDAVKCIAGIDIRKPRSNSGKLRFYRRDVRQPFGDIFTENRIDTAVHLAFTVTPVHDEIASHSTNIIGSVNFLKACTESGIKQLLYISSYMVYGAYQDHPASIAEDRPLRPNPGFLYPNDKAEVDLMFQQYMTDHKDTCVTILRIAAVAGPSVVSGGLTTLFSPIMIHPAGYDPLWQFIHEEDLVELALLLLKQGHSGIFNMAAPGGVHYSEIIEALDKPSLTLPAGLLCWLTRVFWKLRLQSRSPGGVEFLMHPVILNTEKLRKATAYQFKYTGKQAFTSFVKSRPQKTE